MDTRLEYTIYTDIQSHRQMVYHKQDGVIINKLIADLLTTSEKPILIINHPCVRKVVASDSQALKLAEVTKYLGE
jgi:hypothetical protein